MKRKSTDEDFGIKKNSKVPINDRLAGGKIGPLLFSLAIPAIISQLINLLYNIVDRMYIGHIAETGKLALTGLGVCLPVIMLISAFASMISMGGSPRASIFIGKNDIPSAEKILGNCVTMLVIIALILTVGLEIFSEPLLLFFGASENTITYAAAYMRIYCLGTIFVQMTLGLNAFISAQGFAKTSMLTVLIGAFLNVVLDPFFIFVMHMGVTGAALATIISQAVSMLWTLHFLTGKQTTLHIRRKNLRLHAKVIMPCMGLGLSSFIIQSTESLLSICFNTSLLKYGGDIAVGSMTIISSLSQFVILPVQGIAQGAQPITSYNFGAGRYDRVKKTFTLLVSSCFIFTFAVCTVIGLFPTVFISLFSQDAELAAFTVTALRIYLSAFSFFGIQMACQQTFVALGYMKSSVFVASLRKIVLLIPLIYILPCFMEEKTTAIFMAEPIADAISIISCCILFGYQMKKLL